ncbi:hypothetical protein C8R47DRAFT_1059433, partial [Mycena vitilis]
MTPAHPDHEEARITRNLYSEAVQNTKAACWVEWLESLDSTDVWTASRIALGPPNDGGRMRVPTLCTTDPVSKRTVEATSNEEKSALLYKEFFPPKMTRSSVPPNPIYPEPAYEWHPVSDALLHRAIARMKPYKATRPGSFANCVYTNNAHLLVPFLGPIYRSLDALGYYPPGWNYIDSIAMRKPGKTDYTKPGSYRPVCLSGGHARLLNTAKTLQLATEAERAGIIPSNHYG